jgi:hypothetical protein
LVNQFLWSDAWLLAAIFSARRGEDAATLMKVIAWGDILQHAIFEPEEIESGLQRLTAAGLITNNNWQFVPAGEAEDWYNEFLASRPKGPALMKWLASNLDADVHRDDRDPRNNLSYPELTAAVYETAIRDYEAWFAEQLEKLR